MQAAAGVWEPLRRAAARPFLLDGVVAGLLTVLAQAQMTASTSWWLRLLMLGVTLPLAWRRRAPLVVAVVVAVAIGAMGLSADPPSVFGEYLAVMLAAFTVAERCRLDLAIGAGLLLLLGIVAHDWRSPEYGSAAGIASDSAIPVVIWLVGRAVHLQAGRADRSRELVRQLETERQVLARMAVAAERTHLARELHDVVTHSVSVVVIQAQGARRVLNGNEPEVAGALEAIETAGRTALTEMRRLLGLLRDDEHAMPLAPQPGLADLPHLVGQVRSAGLPVAMTTSGTPFDLEPGLDLSTYRIVQEALTNSLKYAGQATAAVSVQWLEDTLEVCVTDTGSASPASTGDGRGLIGMRERVAAYGGELTAGPQPGGGFRVWCRLPVRADA